MSRLRAASRGRTARALVQRLRAVPGVIQVAPKVENQTMVITAQGAQGAIVRGVSPKTLAETPLVAKHMTDGGLDGFGRGEYGGDTIVMGARLADILGVKVGDQVTLMSPSSSTPFGSTYQQKPYVIGGLFSVGMAEYDQAFVFMPLDQAQLFFGKEGAWDEIDVNVKDPDHLDDIKARVAMAAGRGVRVSDWRDANRTYFGALQVEHVAMLLILGFIVLIAALNIISGLIMLVKNKTRDVAILRTIGAGQGAVMRIFFMAGKLDRRRRDPARGYHRGAFLHLHRADPARARMVVPAPSCSPPTSISSTISRRRCSGGGVLDRAVLDRLLVPGDSGAGVAGVADRSGGGAPL